MSETTSVVSAEKVDMKEEAFSSEHAWMVQCLSLAALGLLTYLHIAPTIV
jgi:hypothetical protein